MATQKLRAYPKKRDFTRSQEPLGSTADDRGARYVVHKHHATSDHYDLRLQVGDVLKDRVPPRGVEEHGCRPRSVARRQPARRSR